LLTTLLIVTLALLVVAYAAVPLLGPRNLLDPLPDRRDPLLADLEEERDALLRAIRELEGRDDLATERRDALRARYEAKAAVAIKALDVARSHQAARPHTPPPPNAAPGRRLPIGALSLLAIALATTAALGSFVLPRVGQGTVTTFFADELRAGEALRDLIRAAERNPSVSAWMALGDAYWQLTDAQGAERAYREVLALVARDGAAAGAPLDAYKRLALLRLQTDIPGALELLLQARAVDPSDPETLYAIGELSFALGDLETSATSFEAYLLTPQGAGDPDAVARLELVTRVAPAAEAIETERNRETLLALADVFWETGSIDPAAELYFEVLSQHDPLEPTALSRLGQLLFVRSMNDDAIMLIEQAAGVAGGLQNLDAQASLFLGNAYAVVGDDEGAARAWGEHISLVGEAAAGRVVGMRDAALARLDGEAAPIDGSAPVRSPDAALAGAERAAAALGNPFELETVGGGLFAQHCAVCHGALGEGGAGVRLLDNPRAGDAVNVRTVIRGGRGIMPGFASVLAPDEIEVLVRWVGTTLANPR
jgi:mono/diheme cytochrome c family protein/cytochrome c-type biogenesis protein CcmH/NrfG